MQFHRLAVERHESFAAEPLAVESNNSVGEITPRIEDGQTPGRDHDPTLWDLSPHMVLM